MYNSNNGKLSSKVLQNLERLYKLAIEQEQRFPFFKALHAYLEFALKEPTLKSIIEEQMAQRNDQYNRINEAEEEAVKEMRLAKDRILSIVKKKKIDASDFDRPSTFPVWDTGGKNIVEELEAIENKEVEFYSAQSYSGRLQSYLFDISAGLLKRGYGKELGDLVVSEKEYGEYYQRINGTSGYFFASNVNGNFIFSKYWPKTFEYKNLMERERVLKPWGQFEKAIQFMRAFHNVLTDTSTWKIQETMSPYDYLLDEKDLVEVFHMTEDFYHISGQSRSDSARRFKGSNSSELDALHTPTFKNVLETVHSIFIQAIEVETGSEEKIVENKKIKEITFIKKKTQPKPTFNFYINGNLKDTKPVRSDSSHLRKLAEIAEGNDLGYDKDFLDYINSNANCALYCAGKYQLTKILEKNGNYLRICYGIQVKVITEVEYRKKLNKKNKA